MTLFTKSSRLSKKTTMLAALFCASTGSVLADVSANVAITSDYRFRGISQNDKSIAIQGGFDYESESGFYAGVWASSVDFQIQTLDDATAEMDIYAGYNGEIGDSGLSYSVGFLHYNYPNSAAELNYNFTELTFGLSYDIFSFSYANTSDYFAASGSAQYYNIAADIALPEDWTLTISAGQQDVEDNDAWGTPNWNDYKIGVSGSLAAIDLEFAYIDTSLSEDECFGGSDWCDGTFTITFSKSL